MQEIVHRFQYNEVEGAIIRIMDDEPLSLNEFLDESHRLEEGDEYEFAYTCCYLHYHGRHVLIDAGFDPDTVPGALEMLGITPDDIELVLLTHADRDHVAGLLMFDGSPTYPAAHHVIRGDVWEHLSSPLTLDALGDERRPFYKRFVKAFQDRMDCIESDSEITDGILSIFTPGHRIGHTAFEFATSGAPLIHTGDAFFHRLFAEHPDWRNVTDSVPDLAVRSRTNLVARAAETKALVLSSHMPFPGMGRLAKVEEGRYVWTLANMDL
jgi:glyoxylase-like metal-dependent hydrolase (beta-lactamase superfamily II)